VPKKKTDDENSAARPIGPRPAKKAAEEIRLAEQAATRHQRHPTKKPPSAEASGPMKAPAPLQTLTKEQAILIPQLRLGGEILGYDYSGAAWDELARKLGLPGHASIARLWGGSFQAAKFAAGVGPVPRRPYKRKKPRVAFDTREDVAAGMVLAVRRLGYFPHSGIWDEAIRPLLAEGLRVPSLYMVTTRFGTWVEGAEMAEQMLREQLGPTAPRRKPPSIAFRTWALEGVLIAWELLNRRPNTVTWDDDTKPLREAGHPIPSLWQIYAAFGSFPEAMAECGQEWRRRRKNA
jgi:hypothetical protein